MNRDCGAPYSVSGQFRIAAKCHDVPTTDDTECASHGLWGDRRFCAQSSFRTTGGVWAISGKPLQLSDVGGDGLAGYACQRVPHVEAFPVWLADVKVARQHRLHVLKH